MFCVLLLPMFGEIKMNIIPASHSAQVGLIVENVENLRYEN